MPRSSCDFCCNPVELARYEPTWRGQVASILCDILTAVSGGGGISANVNLVAVGGAPVALGQAAMAASIPVVVASNQSNLPVNLTQVAGAAVSQGHGVAATAIRVELPTDGTGTIASITTSVTPGTAAANLGKAEDAVHTSGDVGVQVLGVIQATPAATAADGDYGSVKLNALGVTFTEPSNAAATYGGTTTPGAAGAVPTTGVVVHVNSAKAKIVLVTNKLDVDVQISLDAGTTYIAYLIANTSLVLDLGADGRWTASSIFAKAIGSNSSSGNIYVGTVI